MDIHRKNVTQDVCLYSVECDLLSVASLQQKAFCDLQPVSYKLRRTIASTQLAKLHTV